MVQDIQVEILGDNLCALSTLRGHTDRISDICNMREGHVITGSWDTTVRMWDVRSGECIQILEGHTGDVFCVHLHSSGYLLTGSGDGTVRIWDITSTSQTNNSIAQIAHEGAKVWDIVELDAGRMLSVCWSLSIGVKVWEYRGEGTVNTLKDIPPPKQEDRGFRCALGILGTKGVLLGGWDGNLMLLDVASYALSSLIHNLHKFSITQIKELKDDIYIYTPSYSYIYTHIHLTFLFLLHLSFKFRLFSLTT